MVVLVLGGVKKKERSGNEGGADVSGIGLFNVGDALCYYELLMIRVPADVNATHIKRLRNCDVFLVSYLLIPSSVWLMKFLPASAFRGIFCCVPV